MFHEDYSNYFDSKLTEFVLIPGVEPVCMEGIRDIFEDLTHPDLLKKCLGSHSQNVNENYNSVVWKFCPKTGYAGKKK